VRRCTNARGTVGLCVRHLLLVVCSGVAMRTMLVPLMTAGSVGRSRSYIFEFCVVFAFFRYQS
jgi:hypothetical protein